MFFVWDNPCWINGFQSFDVIWLIVYDNKPVSEFSGMRISGKEIDGYFPASKAFRHAISRDPETRLVSSMSVSSDKCVQEWGDCQFNGYSATVSWNAYVTAHFRTAMPLTAKSQINVDFISSQSIDNVWNCYYTFR